MRTLYYYIYIIIFLLTVPLSATAQKIYQGQITVTPYELKQTGDSLLIDLDIDFSGLAIQRDNSLFLVPTITAPRVEMELPGILINGKNRHKVYEREVALTKSHPMEERGIYQIVKVDKNNPRKIRYRLSVPFEEWMKEARLDLKEDLCGCGGDMQQIAIEKLINQVTLENLTPYQVQPQVAYIKPEVEEVKARSEQQEAFLDFPVAKTNIIPEFGNNPYELAKIEKMLKEIREDENVSVTEVSIIGYASPEGSVQLNNRLSAGRAEALRTYLSLRAGFDQRLYRVENGGEDWNGLVKLVENSSVSQREEVLSIINYSQSVEQRKQRLKALPVYKQLLSELYPKLRRVTSRVDFHVRGFDVEEAKEVIKNQPARLSLDEMFLVANTYEMGSRSFVEVFQTAVRMFPEDEVANLNAAATALMTGELNQAERYLQKANTNTAEYKNNLGVLHLLRGEYDRAGPLLEEASRQRIEAASHNLDELEKAKANPVR